MEICSNTLATERESTYPRTRVWFINERIYQQQQRKILAICLDPLVLLLPQILIIWLSNLSILRLPDGWLSQKRAMRTKYDIYVFLQNIRNTMYKFYSVIIYI